MSDVKKFFKQAAMQVGAGGSAGFVEVCIMHPLDLVKTRLQMQSSLPGASSLHHQHYSGVLDCIRKMQATEGFFSIWKGILPPILAETPKRAVKTFSLAGLGAGVTEAILVNPFEVVKVTLQANRSAVEQTPSTWAVTKQIVREHGFGSRGLNKGVTATIGRNGCFNGVYFGFYHSVKGYLPEMEDPVQEFFRKVGIGFVSGTLASMFNIPFDVAKSRIQGPQPVPGQIKYQGTLATVAIVYKEEGFLVFGPGTRQMFKLAISSFYWFKYEENQWKALYKGLVPKVMRLGPGGAIMLVVYDHVYHLLQEKFPD